MAKMQQNNSDNIDSTIILQWLKHKLATHSFQFGSMVTFITLSVQMKEWGDKNEC